MREILFKAKEKITGRWVYGYPRLFVDRPAVMITNMGEKDVLRKTVCQYTGLKDANGERIFEGDTLSFDGPFHCRETHIGRAFSKESAVVVFSYEYVGGWVVEMEDERLNLGTRSRHFKITGNIHDK